MNTIEYKYELYDDTIAKELCKALVIPNELKALHIQIDYSISKVISPTFYDPPEGGDLTILASHIFRIDTESGYFFVNKKQSKVIEDYIDWDEIDLVCFKDHNKNDSDNCFNYSHLINKYDRR